MLSRSNSYPIRFHLYSPPDPGRTRWLVSGHRLTAVVARELFIAELAKRGLESRLLRAGLMVSLARRRLVVQRTRAAELVLAGSTFFNAQRMMCTNGRREISPINAFARSRQRLRNRPCSSLSSFLCPPARKIMTCTCISPADVASLYLLSIHQRKSLPLLTCPVHYCAITNKLVAFFVFRQKNSIHALFNPLSYVYGSVVRENRIKKGWCKNC